MKSQSQDFCLPSVDTMLSDTPLRDPVDGSILSHNNDNLLFRKFDCHLNGNKSHTSKVSPSLTRLLIIERENDEYEYSLKMANSGREPLGSPSYRKEDAMD